MGASVDVGCLPSPSHFLVELTIYSKDGTPLISEPFDVIPLNEVEIESNG